jgi:hypothetical protein
MYAQSVDKIVWAKVETLLFCRCLLGFGRREGEVGRSRESVRINGVLGLVDGGSWLSAKTFAKAIGNRPPGTIC